MPTPSRLSAASSSSDKFHRPGRLTQLERPVLGFFDGSGSSHHHHLIAGQTHSETGLVVEEEEAVAAHDSAPSSNGQLLFLVTGDTSMLTPSSVGNAGLLNAQGLLEQGGLATPSALQTFSPSYRKKPCRSFAATGSCKHSDKCLFSHSQI